MDIKLKAKNFLKSTGLLSPIKKSVNFYRGRFNQMEINQEGYLDLPKRATIELTLRCNLCCKMCIQKNERAAGKKDMSFDELKRVLDNLGPKVNHLSFIGGEIFSRPDIFEILAECDKRKKNLHLMTNAVLLIPSKISRLKKFKHRIKGIGVSLDGLPKTHNGIRGVDGAFEKSIEAIKALSKDFTVNVNSVVFKENLKEIEPLAKILKDNGLRNFSFQFELFSTPLEIEASAGLLGISQDDFKPEYSDIPDYNFSYQELKDMLDKVSRIKGIDIMIQPTLFNQYQEAYYQGDLRDSVNLTCKDLFSCRINAQGSLILCFLIKKELGSLIDRPLAELWNSEMLRKLRVKLLKSNLTPACKRCCRLGLRR